MHGSAANIECFLKSQEHKSLLQFMTCGSVDDGKSTLIGRLLFESKLLVEDQLDSLRAGSARAGMQHGDIDFALLVDGLVAESEQAITIDIAYRFFTTEKRKFIVAHAPGHEQYTRNMATAASTADLAVILVDAAAGQELLTQTRRHTYIVTMLGVRQLVLAVNKMDLVGYDERVFASLKEKFVAFAAEVGAKHVECIPMSALRGDNVVTASERMPWYRGLALLPYLETVELTANSGSRPFRRPVQWVNRPSPGFRGFAGTIASGVIALGDCVRALPSAREARVARLVTKDEDPPFAVQGQAITIVLDQDIDVGRGGVLCNAAKPTAVADQFAVHLLWMSQDEMMPGRLYVMKAGTTTVQAAVTSLKYKVDISTLGRSAGRTLGLNEIGVGNISLDRAIAFEPYADSRVLGSFILIDRISNETVGMGLIDFALRRATNIHWQGHSIGSGARALQKGQRPCVIWFTGLSGAGKSTIAAALDKALYELGIHSYVLDGDNVRHGLNRDLGFTKADRVENVRRVAEVASLMADAGLVVLVSLISPFRSERQMARDLMGEGKFIEVFVNAPLDVCEARDPKGLYRKARMHEIANFTGVNSPYEPPESPDISLDTSLLSPEEAVKRLLGYLRQHGLKSPNPDGVGGA